MECSKSLNVRGMDYATLGWAGTPSGHEVAPDLIMLIPEKPPGPTA